MKRSMLILSCAGVAVSGCAPVPEPANKAVVGEGPACLAASRVLSRRPEGPRTLRFEMVDGTVYRNELPSACPPLANAQRFDVIILELQGTQVCSGESFRVVDPIEARAVGLGPFFECRLGTFVRVEEGG